MLRFAIAGRQPPGPDRAKVNLLNLPLPDPPFEELPVHSG